MRLFQKLTALLLCGALLSSCGFVRGGYVTYYPQEKPRATYRKLRMVVTSSMSRDAYIQANNFADQVAVLSEGMLQIQVEQGLPDLQHVGDGTIDFALMSNLQMSKTGDTFSMLTMPFMFRDPTHMSVALNSQNVLDTLSQNLGDERLTLLAAFYGHSKHLLTDQYEIQKLQDFDQLNIALRLDNSTKISVFESLGAQVLPYSQTTLTGLLGTETILPETQQEQKVMINTIELELGQGRDITKQPEKPLYLMKTYHTITPVWLVGSEELLSQLNAFETAVIEEAIAGMVAGMDGTLMQKESREMIYLQERDILVSEIRPKLRSDIVAAIYKQRSSTDYQVPDFFDAGLYEMLQSYI